MKGIVPVIIGGVIFIISGTVFLIFSLHVGFVGLTKFLDILKELWWLLFGKPAFSSVENAFLCYYSICRDWRYGIKNYCSKIDRLAYREVYTLPDILGVYGLQCGTELAYQFPLRVKLEDDTEIDYQRIKSGIESNAYPFLLALEKIDGGIVLVPKIVDHLVFFLFPSDAAVSKSEIEYGRVNECGYDWIGYLLDIKNAVARVKIKKGEYYVFPLFKGRPGEFFEEWYFRNLENLWNALGRYHPVASFLASYVIVGASLAYEFVKVLARVPFAIFHGCELADKLHLFFLLSHPVKAYAELEENKVVSLVPTIGSRVRVVITNERKDALEVADYNYMFKIDVERQHISDRYGFMVNISFWNSTLKDNPLKKFLFCESPDCKKAVDFRTREGNLTIYVVKIIEDPGLIVLNLVYWRKKPPIFEDDVYRYQFCGGKLKICDFPLLVAPSSSVQIGFCGLSQCGGRRIHLKSNTCSAYPDYEHLITSCEIPLGGGGCLVNFKVPSVTGIYTYYGCIDRNGDGDFNDEGESISFDLEVCKPAGYECQKDEECCSRNCREVEEMKICVIPA